MDLFAESVSLKAMSGSAGDYTISVESKSRLLHNTNVGPHFLCILHDSNVTV